MRLSGSRSGLRSPSAGRGLSLVELMVALAIGTMIILTIGNLYLGASRVYRGLEASSRMQESARFAIERITHDLRMAGFAGCSTGTFANVLNDPQYWAHDLAGYPLRGYEQGIADLLPQLAGLATGSDALTVLRADNSHDHIVEDHQPSSAQLQLVNTHDFKQGELLVVTDCNHAALFQMTNVNQNNTVRTVNHNTGQGTPGNCTKGFGLPVACSDVNGTPYQFAPGSRIYRLNAVTYYVADNAAREPALFVQKLTAAGGNSLTKAEEIIEGVQNMQLRYGVDTSEPADGGVDLYVDADEVEAVAPGATATEQWQRVLGVRISLLMVSRQNELVTTAPQSYEFNGARVTPADRRLRKVFTTTVAIRNRL